MGGWSLGRLFGPSTCRCARCHGADAGTNATPAPDPRKIDRGRRRIADPALAARCQADNDAYFARSVRQGKLILGVSHMPPWQGVLSRELAWAIRGLSKVAPPASEAPGPAHAASPAAWPEAQAHWKL